VVAIKIPPSQKLELKEQNNKNITKAISWNPDRTVKYYSEMKKTHQAPVKWNQKPQ
jgi:hypothetical protein